MRLSSHKNRETKPTELSMASMIDVVFLLLIFFLLTSRFNPVERDLDPGILIENQAARKAAADFQPAIVSVIEQGDEFVWRIGTRSMRSSEELRNVLDAFTNKAEGAFVKVADTVPFDMAAIAVQVCKDTGFEMVSYVPMD